MDAIRCGGIGKNKLPSSWVLNVLKAGSSVKHVIIERKITVFWNQKGRRVNTDLKLTKVKQNVGYYASVDKSTRLSWFFPSVDVLV